ncbi:hypothetical protein [uncultured Gemmiger sp.]|uniref:hypothetical protein n=1 Tax=uncultured Gemmiger sp. TaxID=1623490 RepID=UPI00266B6BE4|nr:hypothetical protein [uncultured Gemmiger sp.]
MTAKKEAAPVLAYRNGKGKMSKGKSSICILPLPRAAVKLAITADLVLLLAALGSLNIPAIVGSTLALNALCGLILKKEENIHENV